MEDIKVKFSDAINPGLIIGLISIVLSLAFQFIFPDLQTQQKIGYFSWAAILGLAVYYGIQYRKKRGDAGLPFGKAFAFLFYAMLISSVLSIVFMYLNYSIINPDMVEQVKEMAAEKMYEQGQLTEEQIEASLAMQEKFMTAGWMTFWASFGVIVFALITALIGGLIVQKKPTITFDEN